MTSRSTTPHDLGSSSHLRTGTHGDPGEPSSGERTEPHATPLLLTVPQAAAMLSLGRTTVYELIGSGELETVVIGRARRVPVAAVVEFVEQRSVAAARYGRR